MGEGGAADSELMREQFSRNTLFFGEEGQAGVRGAFVIVVGLGGVGSHAAHMLARSGVERLRLIDFDNVTLSSLNRHAVAIRADVGRPKVTACAEHFRAFAPRCRVEAVAQLFKAELADELLAGAPAYVVDAIDDVPTKADLLEACARLGLRAVSCLGAGAKADPTRILIGGLSDAMRDPLAAKLRYILRYRLKRKLGDEGEWEGESEAVCFVVGGFGGEWLAKCHALTGLPAHLTSCPLRNLCRPSQVPPYFLPIRPHACIPARL